MKYFIESIEEVKNGSYKNGIREYCMKIEDEDTNKHQINFRTNYQLFLDDEKKVWGFDPFNHRRCYYSPLRIETLNGSKIQNFENALRLYLKVLDIFENSKYLEQHERKELFSDYENDGELEIILSEWRFYLESRSLPWIQ